MPRLCSEPGCARLHYGHGLCRAHRDTQKRRQRGQRTFAEIEQERERRLEPMLELLNQGLSTREIADRIGVTKNAVVGRFWRRGISARDIGNPASTFAGRMAALDLFPEPGCCLFGHGEPGKPGFRFCGAPVAVDASYCDEHVQVVRVRFRAPAGFAGALAAILSEAAD